MIALSYSPYRTPLSLVAPQFLFADNMAAIRYALETLQTEEKKQWRMPLFDGEDKALHVRARDELTTVVWAMLVTLFSTMWGSMC